MKTIREEILEVLNRFGDKFSDRGLEYMEDDEGIDLILNIVASKISKLKPDTYLLGCRKHWSDDSSATCTCDENEATAGRFYRQALKDVKEMLK